MLTLQIVTSEIETFILIINVSVAGSTMTITRSIWRQRTIYLLFSILDFRILIHIFILLFILLRPVQASGAAARSVTAKPTGCGFNSHSRRWNIYLNLYFHVFALVSRLSAMLSSATQHAMPPEFGRKWGTECLNRRFPLPTLLCAGYSNFN